MEFIVRNFFYFVLFSFLVSKGFCEVKAPTLRINGFTIVSAHMTKQQRKDNGKGGADPFVSIGASDLFFTVEGEAPNTLKYLYRVNFETIPGSDSYVNKNYVEFGYEGFGTFQAGAVKGPEGTMPESGFRLIGGANGVEGGINGIYNFSSGAIKGDKIIGDTKNSTKVVFYSPQVSGFQLGVGFTPNTSHMGDSSRNNARVGSDKKVGNFDSIYFNKENMPFGRRNISLALAYRGSYEKWSYNFVVLTIREKATYVNTKIAGHRRYPLHDTNTYQLTAAVGYDKFRIAAGWADNGKSRLPKDKETADAAKVGEAYLGNSGKAWNVGFNYTFGAYQFGTFYHRTDRKTSAVGKASNEVIAASLDLSAFQGLKVFGEVDFIKTKTNQEVQNTHQIYLDGQQKGDKAIGNNSGAAFIIGTKISF